MMKRSSIKNVIYFIFAVIAVFALYCRFDVVGGSYPEAPFLNTLNKLNGSFASPEFTDLIVLGAVFFGIKYVHSRDGKIIKGTLLLALLLSVLLVTATSYERYNSAFFLVGSSFQFLLSCFCIVGYGIVIYCVLRCINYLFEKNSLKENAVLSQKNEKNILLIGFGIILIGWLPWIILNYPGSQCPDSVNQFKQFFGYDEWNAGQPPFSTAVMGCLFVLGRFLIDANFGHFMYCLVQTLLGAWIFSLSMQKLYKLGIPGKWCMVGNLFFAFSPFWGTYAQWVEKDLLYAEFVVLQTICMMEVLVKKECEKKDMIFLVLTSVVAVLLRDNGIYAVIPALLIMVVWLKGRSRKRLAVVLLLTFALYQGVTNGIYPLAGIGDGSISEMFSIPFQQTARYVCEHAEELTEKEIQVLEREFGSLEIMYGYNPVISDPIKNYFRCKDLKEYFEIWFQMFLKHPGTYVEAFINKAYGYIAPVSQNIEGWIQIEDYYDYMEELGVYHVFDQNTSNILAHIWNMSMYLPLVKYLCTPGLYTWIVMVLALMLVKKKRYGGLILFVPAFINILVCLASPLAGAIRYELPTVATVPLLIGWAYYCMHHEFLDRSKKDAIETL